MYGRGSLLVIPCGKALLYAETDLPAAARSPMPELPHCRAGASGQALLMRQPSKGALASLFGSGSSSLSAVEDAAAAPEAAGTAQPGAMSLNSADRTSQQGLLRLSAADCRGKLADAGQKLDELKRTLDRLNAMQK